MKLRIYLRDRFDAVTSVVSAILAITIVIAAAVSTIFWGIPYVDELRSKESLESAENQFNLIVDNVKDIVLESSEGKNVLTVAIDEGSIFIDNTNYDRTILMYSNKVDSKYNFKVSGLDDNNKEFDLNLNMSDYSNINAKGRFYNYSSDSDDYYEEKLTVSAVGKVTSSADFKGRVYIFLYDGAIIEQNLFGKIWLFDSNSLIFTLHSSDGTHKLSLEKGGIIYIKNGDPQVKRLFNVYLESNSFGLHVLQTLALESFSAGGKGFNIRISVESRGSWIQEIDDIYNLRLQLYGENAETWLNYIDNNHKNKFILSDDDTDGSYDTLFLSESSDGVQITFLNSIVDIDKI